MRKTRELQQKSGPSRKRRARNRNRKSGVKLWFGKHLGKDLCDIPTGYLRWLATDFEVTPDARQLRGSDSRYRAFLQDKNRDLKAAAIDELANRKGKQ